MPSERTGRIKENYDWKVRYINRFKNPPSILLNLAYYK